MNEFQALVNYHLSKPHNLDAVCEQLKKENKIMDSRKIPDILLKKSSIENKVLNIESSNNSHNINNHRLIISKTVKSVKLQSRCMRGFF